MQTWTASCHFPLFSSSAFGAPLLIQLGAPQGTCAFSRRSAVLFRLQDLDHSRVIDQLSQKWCGRKSTDRAGACLGSAEQQTGCQKRAAQHSVRTALCSGSHSYHASEIPQPSSSRGTPHSRAQNDVAICHKGLVATRARKLCLSKDSVTHPPACRTHEVEQETQTGCGPRELDAVACGARVARCYGSPATQLQEAARPACRNWRKRIPTEGANPLLNKCSLSCTVRAT